MLEVIEARYVKDYMIHVRFNNGEAGMVDLKDYLWGPMFEPLKDLNVFKRFTVSNVLHTICWENTADLAPESLYERMVEQSPTAQSETTNR